MFRSRGGMASPLHLVPLLLSIITLCRAGPLGPLPNVTSADLGLKEGSCALGDVVYMPGDEFPGSSPCERCVCAGGGVQCEKQICESRPGCKALHRPDHCCPTYQCECEQEGRIYSNGEKLVDPADPCRVCYCQGGEVVCRRIACFVRDDCTPRLVPGRCCPEYDNCPLRGVTSLPGASSSISSVSESIEVPPPPPKENIKQEITIKEITPVSEIPVITDVKIKEILPVPTDVAEYSSSKSPLIPREATSEKNLKESDSKTESPSVIEIHSSSPFIASSPDTVQFAATENKEIDLPPSKISFSTQDSINSAIYPSNVPLVATMGIPLVSVEPSSVATTKSPIMEEDDTFDHNPAFPPLPDDLSVLRNHDDEIVPEPAVDSDHVSNHDILTSVNPLSLSTESVVKRPEDMQPDLKETLTTTPKDLPDTTVITTTLYNKFPSTTAFPEIILTSEAPSFKESPMINLRSAIPTEILNVPSLIPDEVESDNEGVSTTAEEITTMQPTTTTTTVQPTTVTTELPIKLDEITTPSKIDDITTERKKYEGSTTDKNSEEFVVTTERTETSFAATSSTEVPTATTEHEIVTSKISESETEVSTKEQEPEITTSIVKSNLATEFTSQTELSSLPIETSDQNPPEVSENTTNDKTDQSTTTDSSETSTKVPPTTSEIITVSRSVPNEITGFENVETTEFILTSFGSSETATDAVELIKISAEPEKSAAIIESDSKKNNVLNDLISLISDVASIGNHTDEQKTEQSLITTTTSISESEELIPVNAGYKSKNKNFNQNSITEVPFKSKIPNQGNKQKVVEIEDDESESVTDSVPPNDKVEPTTRRPLIDNVTDDMVANKTDKTDIEIIRKSYVPTISRRPTKVVMKKSEIAASDESSAFSASAESSTDSRISEETAQTTAGTSTAVTEPPRKDAAPPLTDAQ